MARILRPLRLEDRLKTTEHSGWQFVSTQIHRQLSIPLANACPEAEKEMVSGQVLRCDNNGSHLLGRNSLGFTEFRFVSYWYTVDYLLHFYNYIEGYDAMYFRSDSMQGINQVWLCNNDGAPLVNFHQKAHLFVPGIRADFVVDVIGLSGTPHHFVVYYYR